MIENDFEPRPTLFDEFEKQILSRNKYNRTTPDHAGDVTVAQFGRFLRATRESKGLSQAELALVCDLDESIVMSLEHGLIPAPQIEAVWLERLAAVLDESLDLYLALLNQELLLAGYSKPNLFSRLKKQTAVFCLNLPIFKGMSFGKSNSLNLNGTTMGMTLGRMLTMLCLMFITVLLSLTSVAEIVEVEVTREVIHQVGNDPVEVEVTRLVIQEVEVTRIVRSANGPDLISNSMRSGHSVASHIVCKEGGSQAVRLISTRQPVKMSCI